MSFNIVCDGPGPHTPANGVIGQSDSPNVTGMRCSSPNCVVRPTAAQTDDRNAITFILAQLPAAVTKAKAILANPGDAANNPTAAEQRVAWALTVLDLQKRYR